MDETGNATAAEPLSIFRSDLPLAAKLERARTELLDLSARNRLLNVPRSSRSARTIEVVDERSAEVFRLLVRDGRALNFAAGRGAASEDGDEVAPETETAADLAQPEDEGTDERGVQRRHADTRLQTRLTSAGLQKRLLDLYFDARTLEEEQGVNILFLALGSLKWIDPGNATLERRAPLILVPVRLERGTAGERFKLRWRQEDQAANLSLEAYLDRVHALAMPPLEPGEDFDPAAYLAAVAAAVSSKPGWAVLPDDIVLGFFSFSKFLMYRDLDPEVWPADGKLTDLPLIRGLLADGFEAGRPGIPEDAAIDPHIPPAQMLHIVDSDSSQTLAVHDVRAGRDLIIQGPPGTGKSQTIANIIASAVADGRTVLFVAEKMAALEVVKRRLDQAGVGDACLELHSNKANKRALLDELRRTWELGAPAGDAGDGLNARLEAARDRLNDHAARLHRPHRVAGMTPYQVIGELTRLAQAGRRPADLVLERPESWSPEDRRQRSALLAELAERVAGIGRPLDHPWHGVGLESVLPTEVDRLLGRVADLRARLAVLVADQALLAETLGHPPPLGLGGFAPLADLAHRVAGAPPLDAEALAAGEWDTRAADVAALLLAGAGYRRHVGELGARVLPAAWTTDLGEARRLLADLPEGFAAEGFDRIRRLHDLLPRLLQEAGRLARLLGQDGVPESFLAIDRAASTAQRVAVAPEASPEAFNAAVWDHGVDQAADLVEAVAALDDARRAAGDRVVEAAWSTELAAARQTLAVHGTSFLRTLNGDWRRASRLVKSVLREPEAGLPEQLALLDTVIAGQAAMARIRDGEAFGRAAFGAHWRGDRSAAAPLQALVDWMRSLRGLGAEPRLIAARPLDRGAVGVVADRVRTLLDEALPLLRDLWADLGTQPDFVFAEAIDAGRADPVRVMEQCSRLAAADADCRAIMAGAPGGRADRLAVLDRVIDGQVAARSIAAGEALGRACFGQAWAGPQSDWPALAGAHDWIAANPDIRHLAAGLDDRALPSARARQIEEVQARLLRDLAGLLIDLRADAPALFGGEDALAAPASVVDARLGAWLAHGEQLSKWVVYRERSGRARAMGLAALVDRLDDGRLAPGDGVPTFEMACYEALLADMVRMEPALGRFDGQLHGRQVAEFAQLDRQRIAAAAVEVVRAHHRGIPPRDGGAGPLGVLKAEMARRRGHMPIRQLMHKAAPAIQKLKPVLMMSPLSVAQFLPPGLLTFDLLVMDEASQIQPVDALGAIARCRQVVVVGDERQLPPTRFFAKMINEQPDDEDGAQVADIESILGLFTARGLAQRMLRWHYRSRHQSLIAVSNSQFYENKLFIVPSPYTGEAGMGLRFHPVAGGVFDSANTGTNAVEAKVVAEAIVDHARRHPGLSLGVATFSVKQRRAIQDQLELLRRLHPETEAFFHSHPSEPFFVKNLENVQGDEREVILISVGYARNPQGYLAMRFGPLSADGGERRLNVLISRAKRRCEVFASITDEDIDLERGRGRGVAAFKLFLHFARTGRLGLAQPTGRDHDSVFEAQVAARLQAMGYQVHPQVGIAGFFIDLAIADPERPGRYLLGIECDGAAYHAARSARDRDRLRQAVLEDHGWIIHRIWSTDWFQRPNEQLDRVVAAIEAAKAELDARLELATGPGPAVSLEVVAVEREEATEIALSPATAPPPVPDAYVEAVVARADGDHELHETPTGLLAELVVQMAAIEGPVHVDEVVVRLRQAWGLQRAGQRIQQAVERAVAAALADGRIVADGRFLSAPGAPARVRDRGAVQSLSLRRLDMLPPAEIRQAILETVHTNLGADRDEIAQAVSRRLGFRMTSPQLRECIGFQVDVLAGQGDLVSKGDLLVVPDV
ncbi:AAA domain-containing protein [Stella humosa]|uniref:AAA domain-containing protein n=1 Tax=Stella humosa TaxID=94 RepID=A0A3N1KP73_9PROT|nr:DUF3320 domain-containing protein [Stella humosa]ROP81072.1 AAA domain-containing protein [Stella humosa]